MDPNPKSFPVLSYVMARIPTIGPRTSSSASNFGSLQFHIEQPNTTAPLPADAPSSSSGQIIDHMPHLSDPNVLASMTRAVRDVAHTRSVLKTLGERPDHETVDTAKAKLAEIEAKLSKQLEEIVLSPRPVELDRFEWRAHQAEKGMQCRQLSEKEKTIYRGVIQLYEMHESYEKLLKEAEKRLLKIYQSAERGVEEEYVAPVTDEINEEVVGILHDANGIKIERIDISGRRLRILPEAFGQIRSLTVLNVSSNQLQVIPDSIAGLENLEELNASSNLLDSLPDSIGLLQKLKFLNVSGNKLNYIPESICNCRSLVELDVSFNGLAYLPTNIGYDLGKLRKLSIQLNKISSLPTSVCEMRSLSYLDAHFNELHGLPLSIERLVNLEVLDLSSNFSDLKELPDTLGELTNLKELDLSNNQIRVLPDTFGRLDSLIKLNLDQNPIVIPPVEVVEEGVEAVKMYMAKRWIEILVEEEKKNMISVHEPEQTGWLTRSGSWLKSYASSVTEYVTSPRTSRDLYLHQQL